jgi:lipopolysaccharide transport system permease protein
LLFKLTERDIFGRYRGSLLGITWSFVQPLMMLAVYTFVFSQVFQARWGGSSAASPRLFAMNLFVGLIVFNLFSEVMVRSPGLVTENPNYVKKVIFPLEILVPVALGSGLFHAGCSLLVLFAVQILLLHYLPLTALFLPFVWLPFLLGSLGLGWILSVLGVFLREMSQLIVVVMQMLMFLTPIFYPLSALPQEWRPLLRLNPLAPVIEETRAILLEGRSVSLYYIIAGSLAMLIFCEICFRVFLRSKGAFADVI